MISYLTGKLISKNKNSLVVLTQGGVGYEVKYRMSNVEYRLGDEVRLHTYMKVSENDMSLYGFETVEEKEFFELLMTVKGIGPRSAMSILGVGSIDKIQDAISRGDVKYLTAVQGMGRKTAERLCVELKNKINEQRSTNNDQDGTSDSLGEVVDALVSMGYGKDEARDVVKGLESEGKSTEELLKMALQALSH